MDGALVDVRVGCLGLDGGMLGGGLACGHEDGGLPDGLGGGKGVEVTGGRVEMARSAPLTENPGLRRPSRPCAFCSSPLRSS